MRDGQGDGAARAEQLGRAEGAGGNVEFQPPIFAEELLGLSSQGDLGRRHAHRPGASEGVRLDRGIRVHVVTQVDVLAMGPLEPGRRLEWRIGVVFLYRSLRRLDCVCPAAQRSGEQEEAQEECQEQLAKGEARGGPAGWAHVALTLFYKCNVKRPSRALADCQSRCSE